MACKNCKNSENLNTLGKLSENLTGGLAGKKLEILNRVWDKSMGKLKRSEFFIVFVFAWFPVIIGYITIIKFLISIF